MFHKISSLFHKVWPATGTKQNKQRGQEPQQLTDENLGTGSGKFDNIMKTKHDTVKN